MEIKEVSRNLKLCWASLEQNSITGGILSVWFGDSEGKGGGHEVKYFAGSAPAFLLLSSAQIPTLQEQAHSKTHCAPQSREKLLSSLERGALNNPWEGKTTPWIATQSFETAFILFCIRAAEAHTQTWGIINSSHIGYKNNPRDSTNHHTEAQERCSSCFLTISYFLHLCGPAAGNTNLCEVFPGSSGLPQRDPAARGNPGNNQFWGPAYGKSRHAKRDAGLKMRLVRDNEGDGRQLKRRKVTIWQQAQLM